MASTWRKGLRWDKAAKAWRYVKSGRLISASALAKRKKPRTWRRGLRWRDGRWISVETGKALSPVELSQRKEKFPLVRRPKPKPKPKPKPRREFDIVRNETERLKEALTAAGIPATFRTHKNKDGSFDAELVLDTSDPDVSTYDAILELEEAFKPIKRRGVWISVGTRADFVDDKELYARKRGLKQTQSYYRAATDEESTALAFLTAREIARRVEERHSTESEQVFLRLHWTPSTKRPKRLTVKQTKKGK